MQVVGKRIKLHSHESVVQKNDSLSIINENKCIPINKSPPSMLSLSIELFDHIFDYLDAPTILFSVRNVCRRFRQATGYYNRYMLDFESISLIRFEHMCRRIQPESVISLKLSDRNQTPGQVEYFLSLVDIRRFSRLRHLSVAHYSDQIFNKIFNHIINCRSLVSLSIYLQYSVLMRSPQYDEYEYYEGHDDYFMPVATLAPLSSVIAQLNLCKLEINLSENELEKMRWPVQCSFQHLEIGRCTYKQYCTILRHSPYLRKLVLDNCDIEEPNETISETYHPLTSLSLKKCNIRMIDFEQILSCTPSLEHLKIVGEFIQSTISLNGHRLEEFICNKLRFLKNFQISVDICERAEHFSIESFLTTFRTPFWIEDKQWFFICKSSSDYLNNFLFHSTSMPLTNVHYPFDLKRIFYSTLPTFTTYTLPTNGITSLHIDFYTEPTFTLQDVGYHKLNFPLHISIKYVHLI
jgi:hypothetical protein